MRLVICTAPELMSALCKIKQANVSFMHDKESQHNTLLDEFTHVMTP